MDHHQWKLSATCPADWVAHLAYCSGGFFHSPAGLGAGAPDGEPVFALLPEAGQVVGLAVGMRSRCRLSRRPRHVYWPTLPALALTSGQDAALIALVHACADLGAAEVVVDSFDACWQPDPGCDPSAGASRARLEYLVALDADLILDTGLIPFRERFPERFIECGIAEQDMVSMAGAMALKGALPVVHSMIPMPGRRSPRCSAFASIEA